MITNDDDIKSDKMVDLSIYDVFYLYTYYLKEKEAYK